jgi:ferredoxin-NADP reductase
MLAYAAVVGVLYSVTDLKFAPEEALLLGNLFAFILAPNRRLELTLQAKKAEAKEMYSYIFSPSKRLKYTPGQYMEWTLPMSKADARGNRRYFTLSSSPTEDHLMFTVRQPQQRSSFKVELDKLPKGSKMLAYQLEGSFVLPKDPQQKLVFIAGGIGVTPFRSIIKYLLDKQDERDIILLHSASVPAGFAFKDLFKQASRIGLRANYIISGEPPAGWAGFKGAIDSKVIKSIAPDYKERIFYVSGPYGMVVAVKNNLLKMGIKRQQIKTDYFPGYG